MTRQAGFHLSDEDVYDMGNRLMNICAVIGKPADDEKQDFDLSESESLAVEFIKKSAKGSPLSSRTLSRALGYKSSRSGHILLHRLLNKGVLERRRGRIELKREMQM